MNIAIRHWLASAAAAVLLVSTAWSTGGQAAEATALPPAAGAATPGFDANADMNPDIDGDFESDDYRSRGNDIFAFSNDAIVKSGETVNEVIAIFGNARNDGTVAREIVAVFGDVRVAGPVGREVVAVMGNVYVNSTVDRDVVAFLGDVELGPEARIGRDVIAIGGRLKRDPAAIIGGSTQNIHLGPLGKLEGLKTWLRQCALMGRLLAVEAGLGWAWGMAAGFLAFYVLLAFLARGAMQQCVATLERRPGRSILAALIAVPAFPVLTMLLILTVVGVVALPFLGVALLGASVFGKAVMLAWIGRRIAKPIAERVNADAPARGVDDGENWSVPLAVLIGGAIVTVLYLVPILGFVVYKLLGFMGLGVVLYTLLESWRSSRAAGSRSSSAALVPNTPPCIANESDTTLAASASPASQSPAHAGMPRAGFWLRMGALALDLVLVAVVVNLAAGAFGLRVHSPGMPLLWAAAYGAVMWALKGTTIGGSICGLQLVRMDGKPMDWGTAIMRALGCFLSLIVGGLGFIWIAIDKDQQAWHDKVAGTVVVRTPRGTPIV